MNTLTEVRLWGRTIGAASWDQNTGVASFEYVPAFVDSGIELAPVCMPLSRQIYRFAELARGSFKGLPGLLADSLPDDFGNALINSWLTSQGRSPESFNPVERLCYTGNRGMGALEFAPSAGPALNTAQPLDIAALTRLAGEILSKRHDLNGSFTAPEAASTLQHILQVGTSAGGARAKAVIAWNQTTNDVRSGQVAAGEGYTYWILKFDGVSGNRDKELEDPRGYGKIEYAYHLMARAAGIEMSDCQLLSENGRHHFMTRRFDRNATGMKLHMQSLAALLHADYRRPGAYSYEQAFQLTSTLGLAKARTEQLFRRMLFNVLARNQDDHVKNIAFLMTPDGKWDLAPAFDVTYSYNPAGAWTGQHQMSINQKRDNFELEDFIAAERFCSLQRGSSRTIGEAVHQAVSNWLNFAEEAGVDAALAKQIQQQHRLQLFA